MAFSSINFHYYRLAELLKLFQRFIAANIKVLIILGTIILLFCYLKSIQNNLSVEQNWSLTNENSFDDSLHRIRTNLQYAVIIDAGSSGSRVYIYVWPPHSGDTRQLLKIRLLHDQLGKDVYHSITPGLSSCANRPENASDYISPLLRFASENIPKAKHKETPLYILATAGMRLLEKTVQDSIMDDLRKDIPVDFHFQFAPNNVQVITGKEEGIYSWISINYLKDRFDHTFNKAPLIEVENDKTRLKRMNTISMIEMGGASTQIAFEITTNEQYNQLKSAFNDESFKSMVSEFNLGCSEHDTNHQYRLFVTTFLTLGANSARKKYVEYLINQNPLNSSLQLRETMLYDPCLSIDSSDTINVTNSGTQFLYHLQGSGDYQQCQQKLSQIITQDGVRQWCNNGTCPFVDLKRIAVPFDESEFYGLSEFWYTMNDIFAMGGPYSNLKFDEASSKYCSTSWLVTQDRFKRKLYPNADFKRLLYQCFKSAWISTILHDGFHMPKKYEHFTSISTLNNEPVQWTLGALIFRTRFFPLRTLDNQHGVEVHHHAVGNNWAGNNYYVQYFLFAFCMFAVIISIVIYLKRLHKMTNENGAGITKATAMYHCVNSDEVESYPLCLSNDEKDRTIGERKNPNVFIDMSFT
ncbi:Ectonucleoside triphosphate diphosphohydrolase 4 [Blomia tropicalis]|nr:Ectonucleoside triphosphate diphosphohydrolase 4 [Blomia tropicalis]